MKNQPMPAHLKLTLVGCAFLGVLCFYAAFNDHMLRKELEHQSYGKEVKLIPLKPREAESPAQAEMAAMWAELDPSAGYSQDKKLECGDDFVCIEAYMLQTGHRLVQVKEYGKVVSKWVR